MCPAESKTFVSGTGEQRWGHTEHLPKLKDGKSRYKVHMESEEHENGGNGNVMCYSSSTALVCRCGVTENEWDPHFCSFLHILVILPGL